MQSLSAATLGLLVTLGVLSTGAAGAACDREGIEVFGTQEEENDACDAIDDVISYFSKGGLSPPATLTIRFQHSVTLSIETASRADLPPITVSGYYDARRKEVRVTSLASPWSNYRRPWRLSWTRDLGRSILRHEIVHAVIYGHLGEVSGKLPRPWHEALAYAVQLDLMSPELRDVVLAQYPEREAFTSTLHINDFVYGADPDAFAVAAYKTYVREGRLEFVRKALKFEYEMIDMRDLP